MVPILTLVAFVASTLAVAVEDSDFTLKVLLKRQESTSGAQYQCHSDCGMSRYTPKPIGSFSDAAIRLHDPRCKRRELQ